MGLPSVWRRSHPDNVVAAVDIHYFPGDAGRQVRQQIEPGAADVVEGGQQQGGRGLPVGHLIGADVRCRARMPIGDPGDWTRAPFGAEIDDGFLWGRGATDMKSGVAAFVAAAVDMVRQTPPDGAIVITVTGRDAAIQKQHFDVMKDGVVICNAGQNSAEIDIESLREMAATQRTLRPDIERLTLDSGKNFFLLAQGNLINLAGGDGNPIEVMDLGLALQTLSLECIALGARTLSNGPQTVPRDIEQATLRAALQEWVK